MSGLYTFLLLSILYHHGLLGSATTTRVSTRQGYVRGKREMVVNYKGEQKFLFNFLGIPYAQKPIGNFRFKRPQRLSDPRPTDYDATFHRPVCLQSVKNTYGYIASIQHVWRGPNGTRFKASTDMAEDCLYLNIYTPNTICLRKYPVMVYIHGGGYVTGTPIRDISPGDYLPTWHDVVLVTIQYRLGAFGFFTTGDQEAPGNLGLLDQIEALKWIQNNIDSFCGDKNSVTLLGESAGGSSVSLHYLSPLTKGLFHRGIAVSGVALSPFALKPKPTVLKASKILIKGTGCERQTSHLTAECLRSKSGKDIIGSNTDSLNMQPFVDNYYLGDEPRKLLKEGKFHKLPLMSGFVTHEGRNGLSERPLVKNITDYKNYIEKQFFSQFLQFTKQEAPNAFDALAYQYTPWDEMKTPTQFLKSVIDMRSDYLVIAPTQAVLSSLGSQGIPTYMFELANRSRLDTVNRWGRFMAHENATAYMFGLPLLKSPKNNARFDKDDRDISFTLVTYMTNFAKTGDPTPLNKIWNTFETSNKAYFKFQKPLKTASSKYPQRRVAFWNRYFPTLFPCVTKRKSWYGQCKKSDTPKPLQAAKRRRQPSEREVLNPERELW